MRVGPRGPTVAAAVTLSGLAGQIGTQRNRCAFFASGNQ